jgi:hypothetical protein
VLWPVAGAIVCMQCPPFFRLDLVQYICNVCTYNSTQATLTHHMHTTHTRKRMLDLQNYAHNVVPEKIILGDKRRWETSVDPPRIERWSASRRPCYTSYDSKKMQCPLVAAILYTTHTHTAKARPTAKIAKSRIVRIYFCNRQSRPDNPNYIYTTWFGPRVTWVISVFPFS